MSKLPLRLTAGTTTLACLVVAMLSVEKGNQLCSLHLFCHENNELFDSGKTNGVVPADVRRKQSFMSIDNHATNYPGGSMKEEVWKARVDSSKVADWPARKGDYVI